LTGADPSIIFRPPETGRRLGAPEQKEIPVVSSTKQTTRRRGLRASQRGRWNKKHAATPPFAIHPAGYDAKAPDAKKPNP
jgi:hypothetical protein